MSVKNSRLLKLPNVDLHGWPIRRKAFMTIHNMRHWANRKKRRADRQEERAAGEQS
jgi:hypothetical protein